MFRKLIGGLLALGLLRAWSTAGSVGDLAGGVVAFALVVYLLVRAAPAVRADLARARSFTSRRRGWRRTEAF